MKPPILLLLCASAVVAAAGGKNWALLFTGANGFDNYSTHSNLCHAYQVLHKAGIPDERIVVIMYNDVADDPKNPFPGKLFNSYAHIDVLAGTPMDYTGKEVSAELILAVLEGDKEAVKKLIGRVGKVIDSGPEDNIFVAVSDHGYIGYLMMPDNKKLTVKQLQSTFTRMFEAKKYSKLVFYLESCHSGSMFEGMPDNMNIYAIAAANSTANAAMNYCYDPYFQSGLFPICLGGQFSTAWTENSDKVNPDTYTFKEQAGVIMKTVNYSIPELFGDKSILKEPLIDFFGAQHSSLSSADVRSSVDQEREQLMSRSSEDPVPFNTMRLTLLQRQAQRYPTDMRVRVELERVKGLMADVDRFFYQVTIHVYPAEGSSRRVASVTSSPAEPIRNWDCYEASMEAVRVSCSGLQRYPEVQAYHMSKFSVLINLCNRETGPVVSEAVREAAQVTSLCW